MRLARSTRSLIFSDRPASPVQPPFHSLPLTVDHDRYSERKFDALLVNYGSFVFFLKAVGLPDGGNPTPASSYLERQLDPAGHE